MAERLISVPAAKAYIEVTVGDQILKGCMNNVLDSLPAVGAVEVVRCKDCEHSKCEKAYIPGDMYCREFQIYKCHHPASEVGSEPLIVEANDFCSYGERRCDNG